jgi:hypothetical protein
VEEERGAERIRHPESPLKSGPRTLADDVRALQFPAEFFRRPIHLVLPASWVLMKRLTFPLAVERQLRTTVELQLQRHAPLPRDQLLWDVKIRHVDEARGKLVADLGMAKRADVDALVGRLQAWGIRIGEVSEAPGGTARFSFRPARRRPSRGVTSRLNFGLALTAGLLALALIVGGFVHQQRARNLLGGALEAARREAAPVATLRDMVVGQLDTARSLSELERRASLADLLAELSTRLPRDVWIEQLEITGSAARLQGVAPTGVDVVSLLSRSPLVAQGELQSSSSAGLGTMQDRFAIALTLRPGSRP